MKTILLTFLLISSKLFGQVTVDNGIYRGKKFPFLACYLNVKDSISTIEVFGYKAGQYFDYAPTRTLYRPIDEKFKNIALVYKNDSIEVFKDNSIIKLKLKGIGVIKMLQTNLNESVITENKNNYFAFRAYHDMLDELKTKPNFNDSVFSKIFHSYNFPNNYSLKTTDFRNKCEDFKLEVRKKWQ